MYTLYGFKGSGSAAIEMALAAAGVPFDHVAAASWDQASSVQQLEALNPLKQIPTLVLPDGSILTESAAILIHLGLTFPASGLLPAQSVRRAQAIRGLVYISANCYSLIGIIDYPERLAPEEDESTVEIVRNGARQRLYDNWGLFARMIRGTNCFGGNEPNALDFLAVVVSRWSGTRAYLKVRCPDLAELLERAELHPRIAPVIERHWQS